MFNTNNLLNQNLTLIENKQANLNQYIRKLLNKNNVNSLNEAQSQIKIQSSNQLIPASSHQHNNKSEIVQENKFQQLDLSQNQNNSIKNQQEIKHGGASWISKTYRHNPRKAIIQEDEIIAYRIKGNKANRDKIKSFNSTNAKGYISNQLFQASLQKHRHILKNNSILIKSQNLEQLKRKAAKKQFSKNLNQGLIDSKNNDQQYKQKQIKFYNASAQIVSKKHEILKHYQNQTQNYQNYNKQKFNEQSYYDNPQESNFTNYKNPQLKKDYLNVKNKKRANGFILQEFQVPYGEDQIYQKGRNYNNPGHIRHFDNNQSQYNRRKVPLEKQKYLEAYQYSNRVRNNGHRKINQISKSNNCQSKKNQIYEMQLQKYPQHENNLKHNLNSKILNKKQQKGSSFRPYELLQETISFQKPLQRH